MKDRPLRRVTAPADLRAGDDVFAFRWEWVRGKISRIIPPIMRLGRMTPRYVVVRVDGEKSEIKRPDDEVMPEEFVRRTCDGGTPKHTKHKACAIKYTRDLWEIARAMDGVTIPR